MGKLSTIEVLGDSVLKGVQVNPANKRYYTKNDIDIPMLSEKFDIKVSNHSRFGCTVKKGKSILMNMLKKGFHCDAVVMDFGGNDCDFNWQEIATHPEGDFEPNAPLNHFIEDYREMIHLLKQHGIEPILTTLPPLEPQRFFDWWCQNLNKENVLKWLGSITRIYAHQENYSHHIAQLAREEKVLLVDIRGAFLQHGKISELICEDGTHPNSAGQKVITKAFYDFIIQKRAGLLAF